MSFGDYIRRGSDANIAGAVRRLVGIFGGTVALSSETNREQSEIAHEIEQIVGRYPAQPATTCCYEHPGYKGQFVPFTPCMACTATFNRMHPSDIAWVCPYDNDHDGHCGHYGCPYCGGPPRPGRVVGLPIHGQSRVGVQRTAIDTTVTDPHDFAVEPGTYPATQNVVVEPSGHVKVTLTVTGPSTTSSSYERNARASLATCAARVTAAYAEVEYRRDRIARYSYRPAQSEFDRLDRAKQELTNALSARDEASKKVAAFAAKA